MADKKNTGIEPNADAAAAAPTVTHEVPHPADGTSAPGPYEGLSADRPPVSTTDPDTPIAQSLAAGAGAHTPADNEAAQLERNAMRRDGESVVPADATVTRSEKA